MNKQRGKGISNKFYGVYEMRNESFILGQHADTIWKQYMGFLMILFSFVSFIIDYDVQNYKIVNSVLINRLYALTIDYEALKKVIIG